MFSKKGQVWVETVIYTLIAFIMIGLVLSFARPKLEESKDKAIVEQSLEIMKDIDNTMNQIKNSPGNKRVPDMRIDKGSIIIDGKEDTLSFEMESKYRYSEPGLTIKEGRINVTTIEKGEYDKIEMVRGYNDEGINITWKGDDKTKTLTKAPQPYKLVISNRGKTGDKININFKLGG